MILLCLNAFLYSLLQLLHSSRTVTLQWPNYWHKSISFKNYKCDHVRTCSTVDLRTSRLMSAAVIAFQLYSESPRGILARLLAPARLLLSQLIPIFKTEVEVGKPSVRARAVISRDHCQNLSISPLQTINDLSTSLALLMPEPKIML